MKSGDLAKAAGVNKETLRYYERRGLLRPPERTEGNYRMYDQDELSRVRFIKKAQSLGFDLEEISELPLLSEGQILDCAEVRRIASYKLAHIKQQITHLERLSNALNNLVKRCAKSGTVESCPIIESISERDGSL